MDVEVVAEGEAVDFVEGGEEAEGDTTTRTEEEEVVVVDGAEAEVEEAEEGEVVCVAAAVAESSQTLPLPVVIGSALIQSKSVMQTEQYCILVKHHTCSKGC